MAVAKAPSEASLLDRVVVRLIEPQEREEFDRRLKEDHYLHQPSVAGELRQNVCYRRGVGTEGLKGSLRQKSCYRRQHGQIDEFWDATGGVGEAAKALPRCRGRASQEAFRSGG